jgi:hypothetical protein
MTPFIQITDMFGVKHNIYKNPTFVPSPFRGLGIRGIVDRSGNAYIWRADLLHQDVVAEFRKRRIKTAGGARFMLTGGLNWMGQRVKTNSEFINSLQDDVSPQYVKFKEFVKKKKKESK